MRHALSLLICKEKWFCKLGFFSGWRIVVLQTRIFWLETQKKRWVYTINPPFFRLEKSGCRLNCCCQFEVNRREIYPVGLYIYLSLFLANPSKTSIAIVLEPIQTKNYRLLRKICDWAKMFK